MTVKNIPTEDTTRCWTNGFWFLHSVLTDRGRDKLRKQYSKNFRLMIPDVTFVLEM